MNAIAQQYLAENGDQVNAVRQFAKDLMLGDELTFKSGYTLENAVIAAAETFGVSRQDVLDALGEDQPTYEVEVFVGEDAVRIYLVKAPNEADALDTALEHVRDIVGGEATLVNNPDAVSEIDYDGELTA